MYNKLKLKVSPEKNKTINDSSNSSKILVFKSNMLFCLVLEQEVNPNMDVPRNVLLTKATH